MKQEAKKFSAGERRTGFAVPLGALRSKKHPAIGEFPSIIEAVALCKKTGLSVIQLLPVNDTGTQSSPYSALSAFALHPIYISVESLPEFPGVCAKDKSIKKSLKDLYAANQSKSRFDYQAILNAKTDLLRRVYAATAISEGKKPTKELDAWIKKNPWIVPYAVYKNLKWKYMQATWKSWKKEDVNLGEDEIKRRWGSAAQKRENLFHAWCQMRAAEQFASASDAARDAGVILKGDMPILMNDDSCDAWACPKIFNQSLRAGSPVDGENPTGQNWGFPTYNWKHLKSTGYEWWTARVKSAARYYGAYRLDHILGFFRIWAIPERETTAVLGRAEPCRPITREELSAAGFSDSRIRWLSRAHVATSAIESAAGGHDAALKALSACAARIGNEELWLFNDSVKGDKDIFALDLGGAVGGDAANRVKARLAELWRDRCLVEIAKGKFAPVWTYTSSTSWKSLNENEKKALKALIDGHDAANEKLWKKQSSEILGALASASAMIPCGEDLGAELECLPSVMRANGILGLRVPRWRREWEKPGQPCIPFERYEELSVAASSVHDSSTIRGWWTDERQSAEAFARANEKIFGGAAWSEFSCDIAFKILSAMARAKSRLCIHPLQDFLYMDKSLWLESARDERVNVPGTVNSFNWTYRIPAALEDLRANKALCEKIKSIAKAHEAL